MAERVVDVEELFRRHKGFHLLLMAGFELLPVELGEPRGHLAWHCDCGWRGYWIDLTARDLHQVYLDELFEEAVRHKEKCEL